MDMKKQTTKENPVEIAFYSDPEGTQRIEVFYEDESLWLSQKRMAELYGVEVNTINYHLKEIFLSGELDETSVIRKIRITADDGKKYLTGLYSLDAIIAVGYRVNSYQATRFRIWATKVVKEYMIKGFALDDKRLKQGLNWGKDYFEELLERIREIRASERRFYQKITDIYAQCSIDYDPKSPVTQGFYASVQNKLHWAIAKKTAAEIIAERADSTKPNMGLSTWNNAPHGKILKSDVLVAKNYLSEEEIRELNRLVSMYLDLAELQAERRITMTMKDWAERLNKFLEFNEYDILEGAGKISAQISKEIAGKEYQKFRIIQDKKYVSDFDKRIKTLKKKKD
ncbi:MAG: virulence RhuM family protein [Candidatus Cloacimonetes bacterium]|jgi:hypothetical protein|nr:virulence RhuM family protein [Candidatus Cloacimonadota bacterium]